MVAEANTRKAEQQTQRAATWRAAFESSGVKSDDRVLLALPDGWSVGEDCQLGLSQLRATTHSIDAGTFDDVMRSDPTVIVGTPTDVLRLATTQHINLRHRWLHLVVVTGEPGGSIGSMRRRIEAAYGARCVDVYALSELGAIGWTCAQRSTGIHLDNHLFTFDVAEPHAARSELIVTFDGGTLRTGDLVRLSKVQCDCGMDSAWADGGVLGRTSDLLKIRGKELLPSDIEEIVRRHPAVVDFKLKIYARSSAQEVAVELEPDTTIATEGDRARVAAEVSQDLKRSLNLRLQCDVVPPGAWSVDQAGGRRARRLSRQ